MQKPAVIPGALNGVSNCVPEIQKRTLTGLVALVLRDDFGFDLDIAPDQRKERLYIGCACR